MKIQYKLTYEDYVKVNQLHSKPPKILIYIAIPGYIILSLAMIFFVIDGTFDIEYLIYLAMPLALFAIMRFIVLPQQHQRMYEQQKNLHTPTNMVLAPDSMTLSHEHSTTTHFWKDMVAYKEDNDTLLLYLSEVQIIMVPKKYLPDEAIQEIEERISENAIPLYRPRYQRSCLLFLIVLIVVAMFLFIQLGRF